MRKRSGFTLVEILVAITIISLLSSMGIAGYMASRKNARNGKRRGDMRALQTAFEQYYVAEDGEYPTDCNNIVTEGYIQGSFPTDPASGLSGDPYSGTAGCTATAYCFCAHLEDSEGNSNDGSCAFSDTPPIEWFCVQNQQ